MFASRFISTIAMAAFTRNVSASCCGKTTSVGGGTVDWSKTLDSITLNNYNSNSFFTNSFEFTNSYKVLKLIFKCIQETASSEPTSQGACNINNMMCYTQVKGPVCNSSDAKNSIYQMLKLCINLMPPALFNSYYAAFTSQNYILCWQILESLFCPGYMYEEKIIAILKAKNVCNSNSSISCFIFFDNSCNESYAVCKDEECGIETNAFYLPKDVLCLDRFLAGSFTFDKLVLEQLNACCLINGSLFSLWLAKLELLYRTFHCLTPQQRCIYILRLKFFAFHLIAFSLGELGVMEYKNEYEVVLAEIFEPSAEKFFLSYVLGLGLLNK